MASAYGLVETKQKGSGFLIVFEKTAVDEDRREASNLASQKAFAEEVLSGLGFEG